MQKKIVINFKTGKVKTYGDIEQRHIDLARAKLFSGEVEPCRKDRIMRKIKKLFRCIRYALKKSEPSRHVTVCRPILLEGVVSENFNK
ncbi:MAG: hypothetical protein ACI4G0_03705 [Ruminococcus sp.]